MCRHWTCGSKLLSWAQIEVNMSRERMYTPTLRGNGPTYPGLNRLESLKYQWYHCWQETGSLIPTASFLDVRIIVDHADRSTSNSPA